MKLARVKGTVVATRKHDSIVNAKMLLIQPVNEARSDVGGEIVALDTAHAGVGDFVYYVLSRESTLALEESFTPIDAVITGIVDSVSVESTSVKNKESIFIKGNAE